jgi:hypothetical protein
MSHQSWSVIGNVGTHGILVRARNDASHIEGTLTAHGSGGIPPPATKHPAMVRRVVTSTPVPFHTKS